MRKLLTYLLLFLTINVGAQTSMGFFSTSSTTTSSVSALNTGLVSAYDFTEASGTLNDLVGSNDFSTISGTPTYHATGKVGYGINFASAGDGINLMTGGFNATSAATLSLWVKFNALPTTSGYNQYLFRNVHSVSPWYSFSLDLEADNTWLFGVNATGGEYTVAHAAPTVGTWYHVVCVAETGTAIRIYINNVRTNGGGVMSTNLISTDEQSCIGNAFEAMTYSATAIISNVRWWTVALTDALVNELYTKENAGTTYPW